jgi:hypothetical protein
MAFERSQKIAKTTNRTKQNVNLLPTYEQMIAERLEGITIPDMADAIWVRIETSLDVELPVNEPPATPDKPFFNNPAVWLISAGIVVLIIAIFLLLRNWNTPPPPPSNLPQHTQPTLQPDTSLQQQDYKPPPDIPRPAPTKKANPVNEKRVADTLRQMPFIKATTDSFLIKPPPVITLPPAGTQKPLIDLQPRKKYGVDVSDSDYKFHVKPKD